MNHLGETDYCPECCTLLEGDGYCNTCNKYTGPPVDDEGDDE